MATHYCTYFDRGYLAVGLAMWRSLGSRDAGARLAVLALDKDTATVLKAEGDSRLKVIALEELLAADEGLAAVQSQRSRQEFIFTLTSCFVRYLLRAHPDAGPLIYLDADLYFYGDPGAILTELSGGSVLVVPHRYPVWHDDSAKYGRFNVGVLAFRRDDEALACVEWWRERCLESCALTTDGTRYGDQKYLDEWPARFRGVVHCAHAGINLAPWNWAGHHIALTPGGVEVDGQPLVVFHFAQFRRINERWCDSGQLEYGIMPARLRSALYGEYWTALEHAECGIAECRPDLPRLRRSWREALGPWHLALLRLFWGQFWRRGGTSLRAWRLGLGQYSGRFMGWYRRRRGA